MIWVALCVEFYYFDIIMEHLVQTLDVLKRMERYILKMQFQIKIQIVSYKKLKEINVNNA